MQKWQLDEIRKALRLSKSKKKPDYLALDLKYHLEINNQALSIAPTVLDDIEVRIKLDIDKMRAVIKRIAESQTKAEWLRKKQHLIGETTNG